MKRRAFIGDPHGCVDELRELYMHLVAEGVEEVWIVGDLVDRGPDSRGVIDFCIRNGIKAVQGNHDGVIVGHWDTMQKNGGKFPTKNEDKHRTLSQLTEREIEYLRGLPQLAVFDDLRLIAVHGGLFPWLPFHEQQKFGHAITRLQMMHPQRLGETRWFGLDKSGRTEAENRAEGWVRWYELYDHEYDVVFGHSVFKQPFVRQNPGGAGHTIGVDTGCVFGGALTAVIYPEIKFVSIPARKCYFGTPVEQDDSEKP